MEKADSSPDLGMELDSRIRRWMELPEIDFISRLTFRRQVEFFLEDYSNLPDGEGAVLYDAVTNFLCQDMLVFLATHNYVADSDVTNFLWRGVAKIFSDRGIDYWKFIMVHRDEPAVGSWLMATRNALSHVANFARRPPRFGPNGVLLGISELPAPIEEALLD